MPDVIPIQVVLQGGGAKLGTLIAAAEAIYSKSSKLGFRVSRVAGTSAGAIVAAMLATKRDPAVFREKLKSLALVHLDKIATKRSSIATVWSLANGRPLYNTVEYRKFLQALFTFPDKTYSAISDLDGLCDLLIYACDIRSKQPVIYKKSSDKLLVDALFDSSALPYIFRTFKDAESPLDGGLLNNFPSLLMTKDDQHGDVIGFSFRREPIAWEFKNVWSFSAGLISAMMDYTNEQSLGRLNSDFVHYISTQTNTLDFKGAIEKDLGDNFNGYFSSAGGFLDKAIGRIRLERADVSEDVLIRRIYALHETLSRKQSINTNV